MFLACCFQGLLQTDKKFAEFCENPTIKRVQKTGKRNIMA